MLLTFQTSLLSNSCIQIPNATHFETVVLLSHKKADTYINVNVEFGEGEGKIPITKIAEKAEEYRPSERVTYKMIKEYIKSKYGLRYIRLTLPK